MITLIRRQVFSSSFMFYLSRKLLKKPIFTFHVEAKLRWAQQWVIYRLNQSLWFCVDFLELIINSAEWMLRENLGLSRIHISPSIFRNTLIAVRNFTRRIEIKFFSILWFCIVKNPIVFLTERNESLILLIHYKSSFEFAFLNFTFYRPNAIKCIYISL